MSGARFPGVRFDGRSAAAAAIFLRVEGTSLTVEAPDGAVLDRGVIRRTRLSEAFDHTPRLIGFPSGASVEVEDPDGRCGRALEDAGAAVSPVVRLQRWWPAVVLALTGLVTLLGVAYFKGLPLAARWAAFALPARIEQRMGQQVLLALDKHYLEPSRLAPQHGQRISRKFAEAAAKAAPGVEYRLELRRMPGRGVNAFALPGGTIVLLDGLVNVADSDDEVLGVLGHELGHVAYKHGTRRIFQSMGVGILAGLIWGDFSGTAASVPMVLGTLQYSRDFEREADAFAIAFLRTTGVSTRHLREFFIRLEAREERKHRGSIPDFLSTHPSTEERIERLDAEVQKEEAATESARPALPEPGAAGSN